MNKPVALLSSNFWLSLAACRGGALAETECVFAPSATEVHETRNKLPAGSVYLLEKIAFHTVTCINIDEDYIHHHEHLLQNPPDSQPV